MEVRFENGWTGRGGLFDRRWASLFSESDATAKHMVPSVDVIEDNVPFLLRDARSQE